MSGKAPPKGPRALLNLPPNVPAAPTAIVVGNPPIAPKAHFLASGPNNHHPHPPTAPGAHPSPPTGPAAYRIGAAPPTGPRSLANGTHHNHVVRGKPIPKPYIANGHGPGPSLSNVSSPKQPSTSSSSPSLPDRSHLKGKQLEDERSTQVNGAALGVNRPGILISLSKPGGMPARQPPSQPKRDQPPPRPPTSEPPPPPNYDPPPPPPPAQPPPAQPPPPSPASIDAPQPPPPPSDGHQPSPSPLPPSTEPPPLPPSVSPIQPPPPTESPPPFPADVILPPVPPPPMHFMARLPQAPMVPRALHPSTARVKHPIASTSSTSAITIPPPPTTIHVSPPLAPVLSPPPPPPPTVPPSLPQLNNLQPPPTPPPASPIRPPSPPKVYSLPPPPEWPPSGSSEYPPVRSFKVLFDPTIDKDTYGRFKNLIETVRSKHQPSSSGHERIKGKIKGKEMLFRYEGQVVEGEAEPVIQDPRKVTEGSKKLSTKSARTEFYEVQYEYDSNSAGPPPPTAVLVTNIPPLTTNHLLRRHFGSYGPISSFEPQIDRATGAALGIVFIRFQTHDIAKKCVEKEHGKKNVFGLGMGSSRIPANEDEVLRVVFDGEGAKLKAVLKELGERRKREKEEREKKKKDAEAKAKDVASAVAAGSSTGAGKGTPVSSSATPSHTLPPPAHHSRGPGPPPAAAAGAGQQPLNYPLPLNPLTQSAALPTAASSAAPGDVASNSGATTARIKRPPPNLVRARILEGNKGRPKYSTRPADEHTHTHPHPPSSSRGGDVSRPGRYNSNHQTSTSNYASSSKSSRRPHSPMDISRSPSPMRMMMGGADSDGGDDEGHHRKKRERDGVVGELAKNGMDHVKIDGSASLGDAVREEDVREFFSQFKVDMVLNDHTGWYVTFKAADQARRAAMVLNAGNRTLAHHSVSLSVHSAPEAPQRKITKDSWTDEELLTQAQQVISKELMSLLEKDIMDRVVAKDLRAVVSEERSKRESVKDVGDGAGAGAGGEKENVQTVTQDVTLVGKRSLKGLSFKKQKKEVPVQKIVDEVVAGKGEEEGDDDDDDERPRKRRKEDVKQLKEDLESEDDEESTSARAVAHKRAGSHDAEAEKEHPPKKRRKVTSKVSMKVKEAPESEEEDEEVLSPLRIVAKADSTVESSLSPPSISAASSLSRSPSPPPPPPPPVEQRKKPVPKLPRPPSPPPEPLQPDLCYDDEDLYFARLALSSQDGDDEDESLARGDAKATSLQQQGEEKPQPPEIPSQRVHATGSARTEGYYKISHAEKAAYVAQYQQKSLANGDSNAAEEEPKPQQMSTSRSNRANARRRAQGLEEINQLQLAVALSKGETASASDLSYKFNQLQTRKKHLRFARSPIHDWGLYAMEKISRGEMVIEYVGEVIRAQVAEKREKAYERQGIGSSYLFRIDEDLVVDATKKGNLGRLINHSCDPNCTAKIITISGEKKIVIYAKVEIELGDEITYDYHFPIEQDKIPCLCGSAKCRGYLN